MTIKKWYFKNGFEEYKVLYEDECFILVQSINTKKFSFGMVTDFGSFYGFPVNQSCLLKNECIDKLKRFIDIDEKYNNLGTCEVWKNMIKKLEEEMI